MDIFITCSLRILLSCLCGAIIGFERTSRLKDAGIRTHCIIAIAASLLMVISKYGFEDLFVDGKFLYGTDGTDPARIAAQIVTGIGFLGAGVIFRNGDTLKGLSTAAGVLATAGIGMAIGAGMWHIGLVSTACVVAVQVIFHKVTLGYDSYSEKEIIVVFYDDKKVVEYIDNLIEAKKVKIKNITVIRKEKITEKTYHLIYKYKTNATQIMDDFASFTSVVSVCLK